MSNPPPLEPAAGRPAVAGQPADAGQLAQPDLTRAPVNGLNGQPTEEDRAQDRREIELARRELEEIRSHHGGTGRSGALRAGVFGVNDGLVSNFSLVLGVAGANPGAHLVLLAGIAGLVAGAFSMAAGEYVSMRVQRDVFKAALDRERQELEQSPDEERRELEVIYRAQGVPRSLASRLARRVVKEPEIALDLMARQELGLDPDELGSPTRAAVSSFLCFAGGALLPILPFLLLSGDQAVGAAVALSALALLLVGGFSARLSNQPALYGGLRMMVIGGAAAAVTYLVGHLFGVSMMG
jgi:VIT1/CCC1 family predicted Fe2+/Mn2+ transporter